jgi:predicted phage terminase large subunit-like protein
MSEGERMIFAPCSEKQRLLLQDNETDLIVTGGGAGGSKSYSALLKALNYVKDPHAKVLIVRKTYPQLKVSGGLVDESKGIYPHFKAVWGAQALKWRFPNGATITFAAMPVERTKWQGLAVTNILVDEAAEFTEEEILFLLSRLRGAKYKGKLNVILTCNPDRNSFLKEWVDYSLDEETGVPKEGTEHITRYFVNIDGKLRWSSISKEDLYEKYGEGKTVGVDFMPMSMKFIPMTIRDNPVLMKSNPGYLANLLAQPRVDQLRYLFGSWTAVPENSNMFRREWCQIVDSPPINPISIVRSWDLAATVPSETNRNPDYTAGVKMSRDKFGFYYIEDMVKFRKLPDAVLQEIIKIARHDGDDVQVTIPKDSGSGGHSANMFQVRMLAENGVAAKSVKISGHKGKIQRFLPLATLAESGSLRVVRGEWNDDFFDELERFDGSRNVKDDVVDATADAFNTLSRQLQIPTFSIPSFTQASPIPTIG